MSNQSVALLILEVFIRHHTVEIVPQLIILIYDNSNNIPFVAYDYMLMESAISLMNKAELICH